jgi:hypothetical protein
LPRMRSIAPNTMKIIMMKMMISLMSKLHLPCIA